MFIRNLSENDFDIIAPQLNDWWGGRRMVDMLPRLFFTHFHNSSFVAEDKITVGFLIGFMSQVKIDEAYVHFIGVHPDFRKKGIAKKLYVSFFNTSKTYGRSIVRCVTSPANIESIRFHHAMGFKSSKGYKEGKPAPAFGYDGKGNDRILLEKYI